jgi:hypothetical protein
VDGHRRGQVLALDDARHLGLVGRDREVLEGDRGALERGGALGGAAEVEARLLGRVRFEGPVQGAGMGALVRADDGRLGLERALEDAVALGLGVEVRLQLLEREHEVEDRDVARTLVLLGGRRRPP